MQMWSEIAFLRTAQPKEEGEIIYPYSLIRNAVWPYAGAMASEEKR